MYHQGPPLHYFGILDMHFLGLEFEAYVLISMSEISRETLDGDSESERQPQTCMYGTDARLDHKLLDFDMKLIVAL